MEPTITKDPKMKKENIDAESKRVHLTGCLAHNHDQVQSKFSVKFRKDVFFRMDELGMSNEQKTRNYRRFRDLVLQHKKKHGDDFLTQFSCEDVHVTRDLISFKDHFLVKYPQAANSALSSSKSFHAVIKSRREMKKKKLLERLRYVHNLVEQMDFNEENEDYMDKTTTAIRGIPGLNEAFGNKHKRKIDQDNTLNETELATASILPNSSMQVMSPSPKKKSRKMTNIKRKQPKEELQLEEQEHVVEHIVETVEHVQEEEEHHHHQQQPQEYIVTADEGFPYVIRTTEDGHSFIETENGTTMITFR